MSTPLPTSDASVAYLDYAELVELYAQRLVTNLRGFGVDDPTLALWVPDEDPTRSVRNLLDAAATAGRGALGLRIRRPQLDAIDVVVLETLLARYGAPAIEARAEELCFVVSGLRLPEPVDASVARLESPSAAQSSWATTASPADASVVQVESPRLGRCTVTVETLDRPRVDEFPSRLRNPYRNALTQRVPNARFHTLPEARPQLRRGVAVLHGVSLAFLVDGQDRVTRAGFEGAPHADAQRLMEALCEVCEGMPLPEVRDHAVQRLESSLRGAGPRPCSGIVLPESIDAAFAVLQHLVREAAVAAGYQTGTSNRYDAGPSAQWASRSDESRRGTLETAIRDFCGEQGLGEHAIAFVDLQFLIRLVVVPAPTIERAALPGLLMALERYCRGRVESRLEVFVEEHRDRNAKRRLAVVPQERAGKS